MANPMTPQSPRPPVAVARAPKPNSEPAGRTMATQGRTPSNMKALALAKALQSMKGMP